MFSGWLRGFGSLSLFDRRSLTRDLWEIAKGAMTPQGDHTLLLGLLGALFAWFGSSLGPLRLGFCVDVTKVQTKTKSQSLGANQKTRDYPKKPFLDAFCANPKKPFLDPLRFFHGLHPKKNTNPGPEIRKVYKNMGAACGRPRLQVWICILLWMRPCKQRAVYKRFFGSAQKASKKCFFG